MQSIAFSVTDDNIRFSITSEKLRFVTNACNRFFFLTTDKKVKELELGEEFVQTVRFNSFLFVIFPLQAQQLLLSDTHSGLQLIEVMKTVCGRNEAVLEVSSQSVCLLAIAFMFSVLQRCIAECGQRVLEERECGDFRPTGRSNAAGARPERADRKGALRSLLLRNRPPTSTLRDGKRTAEKERRSDGRPRPRDSIQRSRSSSSSPSPEHSFHASRSVPRVQEAAGSGERDVRPGGRRAHSLHSTRHFPNRLMIIPLHSSY